MESFLNVLVLLVLLAGLGSLTLQMVVAPLGLSGRISLGVLLRDVVLVTSRLVLLLFAIPFYFVWALVAPRPRRHGRRRRR